MIITDSRRAKRVERPEQLSEALSVGPNVRSVGVSPDPELLNDVQEMIKPMQNIYWKEGRLENDDLDAGDKGS